MRRHRTDDRPTGAGAGGDPPGRHRRAARAVGSAVLRHARRHQARGLGGDRTERRQRRALDPDPRTPGRQRLGHRRPQGVHRQWRHRRRSRRGGHRRSRRGAPRTRRVHRPKGKPRPLDAAKARQARVPRLAHRRDPARKLPRARRAPARRHRAPQRAHRPRPRSGARPEASHPGRGRRGCGGRSSAQLGGTGSVRAHPPDGRRAGHRHRARGARVRPRLRRRARGLRAADHREPGHRLPARRPRHRHRRAPGC